MGQLLWLEDDLFVAGPIAAVRREQLRNLLGYFYVNVN